MKHFLFSRFYFKVDVPKGTTIAKTMVGDDMKEFLANNAEFVEVFYQILRVNMNSSEKVLEQCFGLVANLVLRKDHIAVKFVQQYQLVDLCRLALFKHGLSSPQVCRTVLQVLLNIGQIEECCKRMEEDKIYEKAREVRTFALIRFQISRHLSYVRTRCIKCKLNRKSISSSSL